MTNNAFASRLAKAREKSKKLPKLGSGGRFASLKKSLEGRKGVKDAAGLAAWIGRKKYGAKKFAALGSKNRDDGDHEYR